jgi:hypothetical protein
MSSTINIPTKSGTNESLAQYLSKVSIERRKLVKLEIDFVPENRMRWEKILADLTTDRDRAEKAIHACYQYIGLEQPHILWTESPLNAMKIPIDRRDLVDVGSEILHQIWDGCNREIERQIAPEFIEVVKAYGNPRAQIIGEEQNIAFDPLGDFLNQVLIAEIKKIYPQLDPLSLPAAMQDYRIAYLSYFDYFNQIGINIPQIQLLVDLAKSCGCCWAFGKIAILTPKPSAIEFSDCGELLCLVYDGVNILD